MKDNFGDRMKEYEAAETNRHFIPLLPIYARIDGRCFSSFTQGMERPYDKTMSSIMVEATKYLVESTHAKIGYTQSDEISLVWLQESYESEMFFCGKIQKLCSVLASMATAKFNHLCNDSVLQDRARKMLPAFDCRVFQLPNRVEAANAFLWREKDATKNAISMAARSFYSHKALHGKSSAEMQEMIFQKGQNFNDYPAFFKRGTFVRRITELRHMTDDELALIPEKHWPKAPIMRSRVIELDMPIFTKVLNRDAVIFDGAAPDVRSEYSGAEVNDAKS